MILFVYMVIVYNYHYSLCFSEKENCVKFMENICKKICIYQVSRSSVVDDLMQIYANESIAAEYPMIISLIGEPAVDCGGVSRDMLSGFWEQAYMKLFDGIHETV